MWYNIIRSILKEEESVETPICPICARTDAGWHESTTGCEGHWFDPKPQPIAIVYIKCPHCGDGITLEVGKIVLDYTKVEVV